MILYFTRVVLCTVVFFVGSTVALVLMLIGFGRANRAFFYTRFLMPTLVKIMGVEVEVRHPERLTEFRPCVFTVNHQHTFDLIIQGVFIPPHCITIGKKSIRFIPIFGLIFSLTGNIFIDRGKRSSAMESMSKAAKEMIARKQSVWIFPEGTRSGKRGLLDFKKGAFHLAVAAKRPIVPVVSSSYFKSFDLRKWHAGKVLVEVMAPIPTDKIAANNLVQLSAETRRIMKDKLDALDAEILRNSSPIDAMS